MGKLITPFGEIKILIDGKETSYIAEECRKLNTLCPHVLGRYQITVQFTPDGKEHTIACVFQPICSYEKTPESGERLECQSFYNNQRFKLSIGLECEAGYIEGVRFSEKYDYDADYLENGMRYLIETNTKTERYVFGIAWIDNVGDHLYIDDLKISYPYDHGRIEEIVELLIDTVFPVRSGLRRSVPKGKAFSCMIPKERSRRHIRN